MHACRTVTRRIDGVTATFEIREGHCALLRTLSNRTGTTTAVTIPLDDNQTTRYTLRPFQKLVVYPPVGVAGKMLFSPKSSF